MKIETVKSSRRKGLRVVTLTSREALDLAHALLDGIAGRGGPAVTLAVAEYRATNGDAPEYDPADIAQEYDLAFSVDREVRP